MIRPFILLFALTLATYSVGQTIPQQRYTPDFTTTNPYALVDLDSFGDNYNYCRWGNVMSENSNTLPYTPLTIFKDELFLNLGKQILKPLAPESVGYVQDAANRLFKNNQSTGPSADYVLFRKLHFPAFLRDELTGSPLNSDASKVIVVIHGWNNNSSGDPFASEFLSLKYALKQTLANSGWKLVFYNWNTDADTGSKLSFTPPFLDLEDPTRAAEIAHLHGQHLGQLLANLAPNGALQKVQFIAHSAGAWTGRAAARYLTAKTYAKVQITLLDPFMPEQLVGADTALSNRRMGELPQLDGQNSGQLTLLENYYAIDNSPEVINPISSAFEKWELASDAVYNATSQDFSSEWRARDVNQRVDWQFDVTNPNAWYYKSHLGPIQFYANTVNDPNLTSTALSASSLHINSDGIGWSRSMYYQEPQISVQPNSASVNSGAEVTFRSGGILRGTKQFDSGIHFSWQYFVGNHWQNIAEAQDSPNYTINSANLSQNGRQFRLLIYNAAGTDVSNVATLSIKDATQSGTPAAPVNLVVEALSMSRNDLSWINQATNSTGIIVQRGVSSTGPWTAISDLGPAFLSYSDLAPLNGLPNFYRVGAYNAVSSSSPSWSNVVAVPATKSAAINSLIINSINPPSGVKVAVVPNDVNGSSDGVTPSLQRSYKNGAGVAVVAPTFVNNTPFLKWQIDGADDPSSSNVIQISMDSDHTLTAVYGLASAPHSLSGLIIYGGTSLCENSSQSYTATAFFSDGGSARVTPSWQVNAGAPSSVGISGVLTAGSVAVDTPVTLTATYILNGITKFTTQVVTITNTTTLQTYTLTVNYDHSLGSVSSSAVNSSIGAGSVVQLYAGATSQSHFVDWTGDGTGTSNSLSVVMDRDKTIDANFAQGNTDFGTLTVNIQPPDAATAGVTWGFNANDFRTAGSSFSTFPASYWITLHAVDGWVGPDQQLMTITKGTTNTVNVTFTKDTTPGLLSVALTPPSAVAAGAKFMVNGSTYNDGANVSLLPGSYVVTFDPATGWSAPPPQTVTVARNQTSVITGNYAPPLGQPSIASISPPVGALAGGTLMTIQGANFPPVLTVTVGGLAAKSVTVISSSEITCVTPASTVYGTAAVTVGSGSGNATNANGFSYGVPRGSGLRLLGSIGGNVTALTAQGSLCFAGEGSTFLIIDVSNPAAPTPMSRLALPGLIMDVSLFTSGGKQYAAVADNDSGVQIVDISSPTAPLLRGYFQLGNPVLGVTVHGTFAYAASGNGGLSVLDTSDPIHPKLAGTLLIGNCDRVFFPSSSGSLAYVSVDGGLAIVDVSNPGAPVRRSAVKGSTGSPYGSHSIALLGNQAYLAGNGSLQQFDVTDPDHPSFYGTVSSDSPLGVAAANGYLYTMWHSIQIYGQSGNSVQVVGNIGTPDTIFEGNGIAVVSNMVICAGGPSGVLVYDATAPARPVLQGKLAATTGSYNAVEVNGNIAYSAGQNFETLNVSNTASPTLLSSGTVGGSYKLVKAGTRVYDLDNQGYLEIVDVSNPQTPSLLKKVPQSLVYVNDFYVNGNLVVAAGALSNGAATAMLDITNPASPTVVGSIATASGNDNPLAIAGFGNTVYVAISSGTGTDSLVVLDVTNPSAPRQIGQLADVGDVRQYAMKTSANGHYLYVGHLSGTWSVIDISTPSSPSVLSTTDAGGTVFGFDTSGSMLFVTSGPNVFVYDVGNPARPVLTRSYNTPGNAAQIKVSGGNVFVADGSAGLCVLSVPDSDPPQVQITAPTTASSLDTNSGHLNVAGTASDSYGLAPGTVTGMTWANSRGGGGAVSGTNAWSVSGIGLAIGANVITISASDNSGNVGTAALTVNYGPPDMVPPVVNIVSPSGKGSSQTTSATVDLAGSAGDNVGVSAVTWSNARGGSGAAVGTTSWSVAGIPLMSGPNPITVTASDAAGNTQSSTINVSYNAPDTTPPVVKIQFPTLAATFATNLPTLVLSGSASDDSGSVVGVTWVSDQGYHGSATGGQTWNANGIPLKPGLNNIVVTALDGSGNSSSDSLIISYTPLPVVSFTAFAGNFYGLTGADGAGSLPDGYARFLVTKAGTFSGSIGYGNAVYAIAGKFAADGTFSKTLLRGKLPPLVVTLYLGVGGASTVSGSITDGASVVTILSDQAAVGTTRNPSPQVGTYTLLFEPNGGDLTTPQAYGYATLTVDAKGMVRMAGALPDTTIISQAAPISAGGVWQMFVKIYGGLGRISGPVVFRSLDGSDFDGIANWVRPSNKRSTLYPLGFDTQIALEGSTYVPPPRQPQIFPAGSATLSIRDGNVTVSPADKSLNVDTGNKINILSGEKFSMAFSNSRGLFSGVFYDSAKKARLFHGAVLQKQNLGAGSFLGNGQAGSVVLSPGAP